MGGGGLLLGIHRTSGLTSLVQLVPRSSDAESPGGLLISRNLVALLAPWGSYSTQSHCSTAHRCGVSGWPMAAMSKA